MTNGTGGAGGALVMASAVNPAGSAIHQNLADRLKAAKVPGQAGQQEAPAGVALFLLILLDIL